MKEVEIKHDTNRITEKKIYSVSFLFLGICLAILGIWVFNALIGGVGILLSLMSVWFLIGYTNKKNFPKLILTPKGIIDRSSFTNYDNILWEDIKKVRVEERYKDLLFFDVVSKEKYIQQYIRNIRKQKLMTKYELENDVFDYGTPVYINVADLEGDTRSILAQIQSYQSSLNSKKEKGKV